MKGIRNVILNVLKINFGSRIEVMIKIRICSVVVMHVRKISLTFIKIRIECKEGREKRMTLSIQGI